MSDTIPGIHNYCDRWCEKCAFTARCSVAQAEAATTDEERDINNEAFWRSLAANFAAAKIMLAEKAEEFGIEIEPVSEEKWTEYKNREKDFIRNQPLTKLAEKYWRDVREFFDEPEPALIFAPVDADERAAMLEIIQWYQFFISAKIQRGFHGLIDFDGSFDDEQLHDPQSDANGSIKAALIAAERSQMAWTALLAEENAAQLRPFISLLENIKYLCEKNFPLAKEFIRPGFDEINEIVM